MHVQIIDAVIALFQESIEWLAGIVERVANVSKKLGQENPFTILGLDLIVHLIFCVVRQTGQRSAPRGALSHFESTYLIYKGCSYLSVALVRTCALSILVIGHVNCYLLLVLLNTTIPHVHSCSLNQVRKITLFCLL